MNAPINAPSRIPHYDVLIIGAGLSGIGAAWHLQKRLPRKSYVIWEGRGAIGGTWDLFRYPGVRSDSDMFTLGYRFKPWTKEKTLADGTSIRTYVEETARDYGIDKQIRFNHWVTEIAWSSEEQRWTVTAKTESGIARATCDFLWACSGYYRYDAGYMPTWPDMNRFKGRIVHPQQWPQDLDYRDKRVLIVGSGATAITLVPAMAKTGAKVTMLQRSPTYMASLPSVHPIAKFLSPFLPKSAVYRIVRAIAVPFQMYVYRQARKNPEKTKQFLFDEAKKQLPPDIDFAKHFTPRYNPWDERLCFLEDADLFEVVRDRRASVETDEIERFTEKGVRLKSGKEIEADIVVSATGLVLTMLGGAAVKVDGAVVDVGKSFTYKGMMLSGVPNLVAVFGYLNASWTLRADLISDYVCRLLKYMDAQGFRTATPTPSEGGMEPKPFSDFTSGYMKRALDVLPKQADGVWRHPQNFFADYFSMRRAPLADGVLRFGRAKTKPAAEMASEKRSERASA
ncbi:MAG: NAD(P)/FAD-dependent oxidoreductase [Parvularculaceae bacterium]|nr:NAD(P)/FAD-dependent oxidoreductase [Parvularculaceae bacterium]